jgi:putative flippase GtrA
LHSTAVRTNTFEFIKYTAASGAALAVDFGLLSVLVSGAGVAYLPASAISFVAGGVFLYFFCVKVVFRYRRVPNPALELPLFVALGLVGLALNSLVMLVAVNQLHGGYLEAKAAAAVCTFSVNFVLRRFVMFSRIARPARPLALAD